MAFPEIEVKVNTDGLKRLTAAVEESLERALDRVADAVVTDARQRAPVRTGFMRDSTIIIQSGALQRTIHAQAPYSAFVDLGTRFMAARPWFTPAIDQGRSLLAEQVAAAVREALAGGKR